MTTEVKTMTATDEHAFVEELFFHQIKRLTRDAVRAAG